MLWYLHEHYRLAPNPAAWAGIALCIFVLLLWRDRNSIYLKRRKPGGD